MREHVSARHCSVGSSGNAEREASTAAGAPSATMTTHAAALLEQLHSTESAASWTKPDRGSTAMARSMRLRPPARTHEPQG